MAFNIANLALHSHAAGRKKYSYTTTADTLATVMASGYFGKDATTGQDSSDMLAADDIIDVVATDGQMRLRVDTVSGTTVTTEVGAGEAQWIPVPILVAS